MIAYVFFKSLFFKTAWLIAALDTPNALATSVKLSYSVTSFVLMFVTVTGYLFAMEAFKVERAFLSLTSSVKTKLFFLVILMYVYTPK